MLFQLCVRFRGPSVTIHIQPNRSRETVLKVLRDSTQESHSGATGSLFNDGHLVPDREQRVAVRVSHTANLFQNLIARMPLLSAKSQRIQWHARIGNG